MHRAGTKYGTQTRVLGASSECIHIFLSPWVAFSNSSVWLCYSRSTLQSPDHTVLDLLPQSCVAMCVANCSTRSNATLYAAIL